MADDAVKIPISFEVTDLDLDKVDPKDIEKGLQSKLKGIRKVFEDTMKSLDTTNVSKEFDKAAQELQKSFGKATEASRQFSKTLKDTESGKESVGKLEEQANQISKTFIDMGNAYQKFLTISGEESTLTTEFRNELAVTKELMQELKIYQAWVEKAAKDENTPADTWEKLDMYVKSTEATVKSFLADMRELVKTGEAFKLGSGNKNDYDMYMGILKSMQGSVQAGVNRSNYLLGGSGYGISQELLEARQNVDNLAHSLELAKRNLETLNETNAPIEQIVQMEHVIEHLTQQLAEAETAYSSLYDAAYGVTEATQSASAATEEISYSAQDAATGMYISDAAAVSLQDSLNTIVELLGTMAGTSKDFGDSASEGFERASNHVDKTKNKTKEMKEAFSSARNVMTATIMTLNQLGSVGVIIAQIIGIVQLLADAFRDVATASHSVIPVIGLFLGLAINVFGRLISLLKKVVALLKQVALGILSVAKKVGGTLASAVKKVAGMFKSMVPSKDMLKQLKNFFGKYLLGFRSSYFLIRKIRQTVIDGLKELAIAAPEFHEQMNEFSTALNQVKGSLVSAFQPIVSFVIPVLNRLLQVLAQVLTAIAKFNAVLVGQDYYYDYTAAMQDYADGIGGVGKAAKKAQKDLMGFDEINRLSAPNEPSGSGGGLGGTFTKTNLADTADAISWFAEKVKEAWKQSDFTEVGRIIGDSFNDILTSFNSSETQSKIKKTAEKVARSFATLINGFVETPELGENLGKSIANLFNRAFDFLYRFATTVHWDSVGKFLGDGIVGALTTFDWSKMFVTIATFINGLADMIINAVAGHNWWEIGAKIANGLIDGLKKFDAAKAGRAIHDFFKALLDTINGFIATMSKKQLVSTPDNSVDGFMYEYKTGWEIIADKINEFIENLDLEDLGTSTGTATSGMLNGFFKVLTGADFGEGVKAFIDGFMDGMKNYPWQSSMHDFWDVFYPKLKSFLKWAGPKLGELIKEVWETIKGPVLEIALEIGKQIGEGILAGIKGVTDKTSDFTEKLFNPTEAAMYAAKDLQDKKDEAYQEQLDTIRSWTSAERETYEQVIDKLPSWARKGYDEKRKDIEQSSAAIKTAYNGTANAIEAGNIKIEKSNESLGKSAQQTGQTAGNSFSTMGTQASDMAAVVASSFDETTMAMQTSMDAVQPMANNAYNSITGTFDQVPSYFSDTFGQAWNEVQKSLSPSGALAQGLAIGTNKIVNVSVNKMVDAINSVAIAPLQRLSNLMDKLRGVTIGGLTPFAGLPKLNFFKIPKLARGAVLPPNQPFLSIVGDQKQGTNVEAPLETIKQAVAEVMGDNEEAMMAGFEAVVRAIQNKDLSVRIGDRDIGQANDRYNQRLATMRGV